MKRHLTILLTLSGLTLSSAHAWTVHTRVELWSQLFPVGINCNDTNWYTGYSVPEHHGYILLNQACDYIRYYNHNTQDGLLVPYPKEACSDKSHPETAEYIVSDNKAEFKGCHL